MLGEGSNHSLEEGVETFLHLAIATKVCEVFEYNVKLLSRKWLLNNTSWASVPPRHKFIHVFNKFMIVVLDKALKNPLLKTSFICKKLAYLVVIARLEEGDFYKCSLIALELIGILKEELRYKKVMIAKRIFHVLFPTFKIHKNKFRWIYNAFNYTFNEITRIIARILNTFLSCEVRDAWCVRE